MITIAGIDKAELLAALVNASRPQGMGMLRDGGPLSKADAQELVDRNKRLDFDYVRGRPLKVDISGDVLDEFLYDRDNGQGAAARVVTKLRTGQ